jgi:SAM-dependent methyltransferase
MAGEKASRQAVRRLAEAARARGDRSKWFEDYYRLVDGKESEIPWADGVVNPNLTEWVAREQFRGGGRRALAVGCGLGDDAEYLASLGLSVAGFDVAPTAIEWCRRRFPGSKVEYLVADLFESPADWKGSFEFVLEAYTLQAIAPEYRREAMRAIASFVRQDGELLVICRGCETGQERQKMPWPVTREELAEFELAGLRRVAFEDYVDYRTGEDPIRRFRVHYRRQSVRGLEQT